MWPVKIKRMQVFSCTDEMNLNRNAMRNPKGNKVIYDFVIKDKSEQKFAAVNAIQRESDEIIMQQYDGMQRRSFGIYCSKQQAIDLAKKILQHYEIQP